MAKTEAVTKIDELAHNRTRYTFEVSPENWSKAIAGAYVRTGKKYNVPGFQKGKTAPKKIIEKFYGPVFADTALGDVYEELVREAIESKQYHHEPEFEIISMSDDEGLKFSVTFDPALKFELGEYKGIELKKTDYTVHKKDVESKVEERLEKERKDHAREIPAERPVKEGDIVTIDFSGSIDGEKFEGGTAENQDLTIGSGSFIPGFEEQLIGMSAGEEKDITVKFPEDYQAENLAGKDAVFAIKLHGVRELEYPELDDSFISEISDFDTLEDYKKDLHKQAEKELKAQSEQRKKNDAVKKAIDNCTAVIPFAVVKQEAESMILGYYRQMGLPINDFNEFCNMIGKTPDEVREPSLEDAELSLKRELMLTKIAEAEKIELSDEELEAEAKKIVEDYVGDQVDADKKAEMLNTLLKDNRDNLVYQVKLMKAQDIIINSMVLK